MPPIEVELKLPQNWKTTAAGILSGYIGLVAALPIIDPGHLVPIKVLGWLALIASAARIWLGTSQTDAGTVAAVKDGQVKVVESHETPNDPSETPLVK